MGPSTIMQVAAAARFRDDYGAKAISQPINVTPSVSSRSFPVVQSMSIAAIGGQHHAD
ncbi:hypothetical protein L2C91_06525 [Rosenbergiella epipactidis]|uniref:hypothetical protein n=1 Tax=Erwiniaceae TaxID=1903409 RepID=UPI0020260F1B|nr:MULTISPECIES: hypothetical protein [Erwiniaceae]MCL9668028.1 hypothetical protein [Rosenbergiella epipactidis]WKX25449.1 hypothetical protein QJR74_08900 [Tatumella ptyseos]